MKGYVDNLNIYHFTNLFQKLGLKLIIMYGINMKVGKTKCLPSSRCGKHIQEKFPILALKVMDTCEWFDLNAG